MKTYVKRDIINIVGITVCLLIGLLLLHDICKSSLLENTVWNNYELQARAWLKGQTYLDANNPALELAYYEGRYYVSFPPFPSVFLLPFMLIFGSNLPGNLIIALVCIATVIIAYLTLRKAGTSDLMAVFISVFYVFGSNMLFMSLNSGVWFLAQALNMLLCTLAVKFCLDDNRTASFICLSLAVGCRPFSAIYIIAFIIIYMIRDNKKLSIKRNVLPLIPVVCAAAIYMAYNYVRFKNVFEFGHNYLPEFQSEYSRQFSVSYLWENLKMLLIKPISLDSSLNLSIDKFNGFMFYIANPIFIIGIVRAVKDIIKGRVNHTKLILFIAMVINILALCCHKTLGGWQFGARYTCDMIPFVLMCFLSDSGERKEVKQSGKRFSFPVSFNRFEIAVAVFAVMFNIFGAVEFWTNTL